MIKTLLSTLIFILTFSCLKIHSQDSMLLPKDLERRLLSPSDDTAYVHTIHEASKKLISSQTPLAITYAEKAEKLSNKIGYIYGEAYSQYIIAYAYTISSKYKDACIYYLNALANFTKIDNKTYIAKTCNELGIIYKDIGNYEESIAYYEKALQATKASGDLNFSIKLLINLGVVHLKMTEYQGAAAYLFDALKLSEEQENFKQIALIHGNLGNLYMEQEVFSEARNHYSIALSNFKNVGNKYMEAMALNNLGKVFYKLNENQKSINFYNQAITLFGELQDKMSIADCMKNIGQLYMKEEKYNEALNQFTTSLKLYNELDYDVHYAELHALIGGTYLKKGDFRNANYYLKIAVTNEVNISKNTDRLALYENKYKYHEAMAGFKEALYYYKKYDSLREELLNNEKLQQINEIQTQYKTEKQERENQLLKNEQKQQEQLLSKKEVVNRFLVVGIVIFVIAVIHFYRLNKSKLKNNQLLLERNNKIKKQKEEIERINANLEKSEVELKNANDDLQKLNLKLNGILKKKTNQLNQTNEELDTFFYQSSHALRRPLVHFKGLLEILKLEKDPAMLKDIHQKLDHTFNKMDVMLSKLVMASEVNLERITDQNIDFEQIIHSVWVYLGLKYKIEHFGFELNIQDGIGFKSNGKLIEILFQNLIENAINFSVIPDLRQAKISIDIIEENTHIKIFFNDNGIGIPEEQLPKIFGMFTISSHLSEGFGLGLYIVRKVINKLGGHISVKSEENEYTYFTILLPKQEYIYLDELKLFDKSPFRK